MRTEARQKRYTVQDLGSQIRLVPEYVKGYESPSNFARVILEPGEKFSGIEYGEIKKRRWIDV